MGSSVLYRARWTAHSSFYSKSSAPTSLTMAALDLAVQALNQVGEVQLWRVHLGERHVGQHVEFCIVHDLSQLRHL